MKQKLIPVILMIFSIALIVLGVYRGEAECVIEKAAKICMECIGIG